MPSPPPDRLTRFIDRLVLGFARHWVACIGLLLLLYIGVPLLAPVLMAMGLTGPARLIYTVYSPACHQLPDRSYFLFGEKPVYTLQELSDAHVLPGEGILERRRYVGDATRGWKIALCERDLAMYGSTALAGVTFALLRKRARKLPWWVFLLLILPLAVDGLTQLAGLRTSDWLLRTLTGVLFGFGLVWVAYPYVQESMDGVVADMERKQPR